MGGGERLLPEPSVDSDPSDLIFMTVVDTVAAADHGQDESRRGNEMISAWFPLLDQSVAEALHGTNYEGHPRLCNIVGALSFELQEKLPGSYSDGRKHGYAEVGSQDDWPDKDGTTCDIDAREPTSPSGSTMALICVGSSLPDGQLTWFDEIDPRNLLLPQYFCNALKSPLVKTSWAA